MGRVLNRYIPPTILPTYRLGWEFTVIIKFCLLKDTREIIAKIVPWQ
jgi:hypothetical protein